MSGEARNRRGFLLVFALLLTVLISLIALALLGLKKGGYASSTAAIKAVQARSMARSGIGDLWIKLSKDPFFPGGVGDDQERFSYREEVTDTNGELAGSYQVVLDRKYRFSHNVLRMECTGISGTLSEDSAHHTIYAELSIEPGDFGFKVWEEGVSPKL